MKAMIITNNPGKTKNNKEYSIKFVNGEYWMF